MRILSLEHKFIVLALSVYVLTLTGCEQKRRSLRNPVNTNPISDEPSEPSLEAPPPESDTPPRYLYVSDGSCYNGVTPTFSSIIGNNIIVRYNLNTGERDADFLVDYNIYSAGESPVDIIDYDKNNFLVAVDNNSSRRVDIVSKHTGVSTPYIPASVALNANLRSLRFSDQGSLYISKGTAVERYGPSLSRVLINNNSYITMGATPSSGNACVSNNTLITSIFPLNNEHIVFSHSAASRYRIGIIHKDGFVAGSSPLSNCLEVHNAPSVNGAPVASASPIDLLLHSSGDLLVSYASSVLTNPNGNKIYSYSVNTNASPILSSPTKAYSDIGAIAWISNMTEDTSSGDVFIANSHINFRNIERLTYNSQTRTLTRKTGPSFVPSNVYNRCVSGMFVGD